MVALEWGLGATSEATGSADYSVSSLHNKCSPHTFTCNDETTKKFPNSVPLLSYHDDNSVKLECQSWDENNFAFYRGICQIQR